MHSAGKRAVEIYTDGACLGNPGPGGWAAILTYGDTQKEISGHEAQTTNQRMELKAAVEALAALKRPCKVNIHSDSAYLVNAFRQGWLDRWRRNGWKTRAKTDVENRDLWERLLELTGVHDVDWVKVKGHADDALNNRCDELAKAAAQVARDGVQT